MSTEYLFHSSFHHILTRMRTDKCYLCSWPRKLHCSCKDHWSMESIEKNQLFLLVQQNVSLIAVETLPDTTLFIQMKYT